MSARFDIENAKFLSSNLSNDGSNLGSFSISIGGCKKVVYIPYNIPVGPDRPIGKALIRARSYEKECIFINNLRRGDRVDLLVNMWDANERDARFGVLSLEHIRLHNEQLALPV
jgi:hypothetical protein